MGSTRDSISNDELRKIREEMERLKAAMHAAKIAYLNRTPFGGRILEYEGVRQVAQEFILANYTYQKALYGKIKVRLSVATLLR
jgi:hypothetical protein